MFFFPENVTLLIKDRAIKLQFLKQHSCIAHWRLQHHLLFMCHNSFFCVWQKAKFTHDLVEVAVLCSECFFLLFAIIFQYLKW